MRAVKVKPGADEEDYGALVDYFEHDFDPRQAKRFDRTDVAEIEAYRLLRDEAQRRIDAAVLEARRLGVSWVMIGTALDVSWQAARKKYFDRV